MKTLNYTFSSILLLFLLTSCEIDNTNNTDNTNNDDNKTEITISSEDWITRSYSREDLTEFEFKEGEHVAIVDENGVNHKFQVGETIDSKTHLYNPDITLIDGAKYRVQYPHPGGWDNGDFIISLGFGGYECTPTLDCMVSGWTTYKDKKIHFGKFLRFKKGLITKDELKDSRNTGIISEGEMNQKGNRLFKIDVENKKFVYKRACKEHYDLKIAEKLSDKRK
jgi:hypothetical protein